MTAGATTTTVNVTIDEQGALALPPEILRVLRPEGETLTLVDIEIKDETLVLRRSSIAEEDWWAYTPETKQSILEARNSPQDEDLRLSRRDLERLVELDTE